MTHGLNAPFGARCFLTWKVDPGVEYTITGLNAPFGARCFLTAGAMDLAAQQIMES